MPTINPDDHRGFAASPHINDPLGAQQTPVTWSFNNEDVADAFDGHVRAQLPWYSVLSRFTAEIAASFIPNHGLVIDVGASTGNITRLMQDELEAKQANAISIDPSIEMAARFDGHGEFFSTKAEDFPFERYRPNVIVCFLTLMFIPPIRRFELVESMIDSLAPGGAMLIVDKGLITDPRMQVACKAAQLSDKIADGMSAEAYCAKELALRGQQIPLDEFVLQRMLSAAGMSCSTFFAFGEFYGLAAIKPEWTE